MANVWKNYNSKKYNEVAKQVLLHDSFQKAFYWVSLLIFGHFPPTTPLKSLAVIMNPKILHISLLSMKKSFKY